IQKAKSVYPRKQSWTSYPPSACQVRHILFLKPEKHCPTGQRKRWRSPPQPISFETMYPTKSTPLCCKANVYKKYAGYHASTTYITIYRLFKTLIQYNTTF